MSDSHGQSKASWTGVGIILLGTLLICLGIVFGEALLWAPGIVVGLLGVAAWIGMEKAGYGERPAGENPGTGGVR